MCASVAITLRGDEPKVALTLRRDEPKVAITLRRDEPSQINGNLVHSPSLAAVT